MLSDIIKEDIVNDILKDRKTSKEPSQLDLLLEIKNELKEIKEGQKPSKLKTWFKKIFKTNKQN